MQKISKLKKITPHAIAVVIFLVLPYIYFSPLLEGKEIRQSDNIHYKGMSKEVRDYRQETGDEALWTNRLFGGMPAYLISTKFDNNINFLHKILTFPEKPANQVFLCLLGFYLTLLLFGVSPWLSIVGAIAFGFSTYFFIIIAAGHNTKALAIAYMAPLIGGIIISYRRHLWWGLILTGVFLALQLKVKHPQITYYTLIIVVVFGITELIKFIREKRVLQFLKITGMLLIAVALAVGSNFGNLWTIYEYGEHSMRGESELKLDSKNQTKGLDKDYATRWSYGVDETLNLLIPNYKGGASQGSLSTDSKTYKALRKNNVPPAQAKQYVENLPLYHGDQPGTSGPMYLGALVIFLFVFSLFITKGPFKWWVIVVSILAILLSWGDNLMQLTSFFMDYVPGYNKFRTVSMTLVIVEFTVPFFAFLGMKQLFENKISKEQFLRAIKYSLYILGGICVFFLLFPGILQNFAAAQDSQLPDWFAQSLRDDRKAILRKDAFRSLIFIFLGAVVVYAFFFKKMKYQYAILLLGVFILIDMWSVDKRYLNDDQFVRETEVKTPFKKSRADQIILNDKEKNFRVLNLAVNTFNDASTSYFHNHVGGYHGAKLQRYQDLIEFHIHPEMREIINTLQKEKSLKNIDRVLKQQDILNMLNTKYIIYNPKAAPIVNKSVFGNAWFVSDYEMVENANEEIEVLNNINPKETAIIDKRFKDQLAWKEFGRDSSASIKLVEYKPNYLKYQAKTSKKQIIVFSEVYYPHGWKVYVDGELQDHFRANYILRGMTIPPGEHTIEFEFKPKAYYVGNKISKISSIILLLLFFGYLGFELYRYFIKDNKKVIKE